MHRVRLRWLTLPLLWLAIPATAPAAGEDSRCGIYPKAVADLVYGGFSACVMRDLGEKPLWTGLEPKYRRQMRFAYTNGQAPGLRVIDFVELPDGSGKISLKAAKWKPGEEPAFSVDRSWRVSPADVAMLNRLGEESDAWKFEIGSWDGEDLYVDCDTLDMERIDAAGYRYSSVNISCNHPNKLMPLLEFVASLAKLKRDEAGILY